MSTISHKQYVEANLRLEELLKEVDNNTPKDSPLSKELIEVSDIIEQYEEIHFPIGLPTLQEMIELRMFEMGLKRKDLAALLNTSASRISDYLNGKREITLKVAKALHQKLNIDSDIILQ
ncbi:type II toxin-antitoxin system HigA family antitoxin [Allomuricauda sp. ARW1Y1]|jgi:HTH-type transcriptional regulator/antitoxin HigA|uniref:helix-turn-helix domain-containing protein n=1 Tax=Allomuricauda sp. ARW1Y1 TaxID=2663843 RepID=UPI0015C792A7|nr:helix-turn-helix domain-containing protein [Muricauda sp. ARW1Y1]NYJ28067.1 HTH-type transcriptional regulator/antitoxin HigA [Muricauda sp. ARW1Y1]